MLLPPCFFLPPPQCDTWPSLISSSSPFPFFLPHYRSRVSSLCIKRKVRLRFCDKRKHTLLTVAVSRENPRLRLLFRRTIFFGLCFCELPVMRDSKSLHFRIYAYAYQYPSQLSPTHHVLSSPIVVVQAPVSSKPSAFAWHVALRWQVDEHRPCECLLWFVFLPWPLRRRPSSERVCVSEGSGLLFLDAYLCY